ncbi:MAG: hypothetical protein HQL53_11025 [Magnetococcales bacterium]|nr:hypothetical protein [Magnetococcales bacterium]
MKRFVKNFVKRNRMPLMALAVAPVMTACMYGPYPYPMPPAHQPQAPAAVQAQVTAPAPAATPAPAPVAAEAPAPKAQPVAHTQGQVQVSQPFDTSGSGLPPMVVRSPMSRMPIMPSNNGLTGHMGMGGGYGQNNGQSYGQMGGMQQHSAGYQNVGMPSGGMPIGANMPINIGGGNGPGNVSTMMMGPNAMVIQKPPVVIPQPPLLLEQPPLVVEQPPMVVMQQPSGMPGMPGMFGAPPMYMTNQNGDPNGKQGGPNGVGGAGSATPNPVISQQPPQIVYPK